MFGFFGVNINIYAYFALNDIQCQHHHFVSPFLLNEINHRSCSQKKVQIDGKVNDLFPIMFQTLQFLGSSNN